MKKIFLSLVVLLFTITTFAQKTIEKPDYGFNNISGSITKVELTTEATILHFHIKYYPGMQVYIPKESYIQDPKGGEKLFLKKAEGVPIAQNFNLPESGEISYQLYFPVLNANTNTIDFGEANEGGNWSILDIVINESTENGGLPKELRGNWFQTDGSNQWDYGFYANQAVVDQAVWKYKTVEKKKNNYTIVLESKGNQKTIYAQIDKKGNVKIGKDKSKLATYSTEKIENSNYKLANEEVYSSNIFKTDSTTYSGFIKGYSARAGTKTGTIYVNNVFTGNQDSHLVKIAQNGSFSVKFPISHPQFIYVRLPGANMLVFVEPSKETFHAIDRDISLFMGDCARINTDFKTLDKVGSYEEYRKLIETISELNPEAFKKACFDIKDKQMQALNAIVQKQLLSQKALQIKKLDLEFLAFQNMLSYEMYKEMAKRSASSKGTQPENKGVQDYKLEASYYDFITKSILNNELAMLSGNYSSFINYFRFADIFRNNNGVSYSYNLTSESAESLQKLGFTLSNEELEMVEASRKIEKNSIKEIEFYTANQSKIQKFIEKHKEAHTVLLKKNATTRFSIADFGAYLVTQGVSLTDEEKVLVADSKLAQLTKEEIAIQKQFSDKYSGSLKAFKEKYKDNIQEIADEKEFQKLRDMLYKVFGLKESFAFDVFTLQEKSGYIERNFTPYSDNQIKWIQGKIKHPFLSNYIVTVNDNIKDKIEANKTKTGFTVNTVKKTEGDDLFESMIAKFKGKVIYVDFWATWCGPCMSGIKEIATLKEEMKNEDVVFLYITNPTSPEKTWENSIPNIKGEHYRVTQDEWNYLSQKFNISGIPHYVLVNKKGEVVNPQLGHNTNEGLKKILTEQMK